MDSRLEIKFRDRTVVIQPTFEQGGGVDGYFIQGENRPYISITIPYHRTPERNWESFSDYGRDLVRKNGWVEFGDQGYVIALALKEVGVLPETPELEEYIESLTEEMDKLESRTRALVDAFFDPELKGRGLHHFSNRIAEYHEMVDILAVAKNLKKNLEGWNVEWADWPIPD